MIRKPKIHPVYGINLVGINFRERWNIVEYATEEEIKTYVANFRKIAKERHAWRLKNDRTTWWEFNSKIKNQKVENIFFRKVWRIRYSQTFQKNKLYIVDKNIQRWDTKLAPVGGHGMASMYTFDRSNKYVLSKGVILMHIDTDEMGNVYFSRADEINAAHQYVFNRDNKQLSFIVEVPS